jgi:hypothetical protein
MLQLHLRVLNEDETSFNKQLVIKNDALKTVESKPIYLKVKYKDREFHNRLGVAELCMSSCDLDNYLAQLSMNPIQFDKSHLYQDSIYHSMRSAFPLVSGMYVTKGVGPIKKITKVPQDNHKKDLLFIVSSCLQGSITNINIRLKNLLVIKEAVVKQLKVQEQQQLKVQEQQQLKEKVPEPEPEVPVVDVDPVDDWQLLAAEFEAS